jgi:phage FluMu gp28-like protein
VELRPYQIPIFADNTTGILGLHWARQLGKSTVLAAWAVDRLLTRPGRLVTVLSNCQQNGAEFAEKCQAICNEHGAIFEAESRSVELDLLATEIRIRVSGRKGRIKVLAANPRTARGFSGDLILDEFAFHQDDIAIWEAAEPILSSNKDFLCRIASTGNGRNNMFYRMATGGRVKFSRLSRSEAWKMGVKIYDPDTRVEITPAEARARAEDKVAYDQNYELAFIGGGAPLLASDVVLAAEQFDCGETSDGPPSEAILARLKKALGLRFIGIDIGRHRDLTVATILELLEGKFYTRAVIRLAATPFKEQLAILSRVIEAADPIGGCVDMTGVGLGLAEDLSEKYPGKLTGIHFAQTTPWIDGLDVKTPEAMAVNLLGLFEAERIKIPPEATLRSSLQLPERSGTTRGMIYTPRTGAGHADDFWSLALAAWSARSYETPFTWHAFTPRARLRTTTL